MLLRTWRHRNSRSLLLGLQSGKDTLEESLVAAFKAKHTLAFSSVQFSHSVVSDSLWPHGLLHARLLCTSPTPGVYSNSCPSRWWCHPTISSSVVPFSSCLPSFPSSGSFSKSWFFTSGGQIIGVSALALVLPIHWRRKWQPTPVFLPGESCGRSLVCCSP